MRIFTKTMFCTTLKGDEMEFIAYDETNKQWVNPKNICIKGDGTIHIINIEYGTLIELNPKFITIYPYIGRTDKDGDKIYKGSVLSFGEGVHNSAVVLFDSLGWCVRFFRGNDPVLLRTYIKDGHVDAKITGHRADNV